MAEEQHWSQEKEKGGGAWQMKLMLRCFRFFGPGVFQVLIFPIILGFYLTSGKTRKIVREFQNRIELNRNETTPKRLSCFRTFRAFGVALVDKLASWGGLLKTESLDIAEGDFDDLVKHLKAGQGVVGISSHMGNIEMLRALGSMDAVGVDDLSILPIVDYSGNPHFNAIMEELNDKSMERIISIDEIGPQTIIEISDFIDTGGMLVVAADRTSPGSQEKTVTVEFLGKEVELPLGVFVLVDILKVPVYYIFSTRDQDFNSKGRYAFHVVRSDISLKGKRSGRAERIPKMAQEFAKALEKIALRYPHQWFNFFRFWKDSDIK